MKYAKQLRDAHLKCNRNYEWEYDLETAPLFMYILNRAYSYGQHLLKEAKTKSERTSALYVRESARQHLKFMTPIHTQHKRASKVYHSLPLEIKACLDTKNFSRKELAYTFISTKTGKSQKELFGWYDEWQDCWNRVWHSHDPELIYGKKIDSFIHSLQQSNQFVIEMVENQKFINWLFMEEGKKNLCPALNEL